MPSRINMQSIACLCAGVLMAASTYGALALDSSVTTLSGNVVQISKSGEYIVRSGDRVQIILVDGNNLASPTAQLKISGTSLKAEAIFTLHAQPPPAKPAPTYLGALSTPGRGKSTVTFTIGHGEITTIGAYSVDVR